MTVNGLTKEKAIRNTIRRAVTEGWWLTKAVSDATAWLQKNELSRRTDVEAFVSAEYSAAGLDSHGRKQA